MHVAALPTQCLQTNKQTKKPHIPRSDFTHNILVCIHTYICMHLHTFYWLQNKVVNHCGWGEKKNNFILNTHFTSPQTTYFMWFLSCKNCWYFPCFLGIYSYIYYNKLQYNPSVHGWKFKNGWQIIKWQPFKIIIFKKKKLFKRFHKNVCMHFQLKISFAVSSHSLRKYR